MYLITNRNLCSREKYLSTIVEAAKNGVEYLILREKDLKYQELESLYLEILQELEENSTDIKIIVNSSIELYNNYSVYGIHLPYNKFKSMLEDNYKFDRNKAIGLSLHTVEEVVELEKIIQNNDIKIEYITLSHIYETKCKEGLKPKGIELLKKARNITKIKIVALGGILPQNVGEIVNYCDDFAIMSTLFKSDDVKKTIEEYNENIK
ncbi:MAG: thiamine phosphate synthase [Intestinibacter sp.]|uniref:thiamine phosphate synthase n=1 Tax=Intestinibacter sp. TaxID=1965304 RepID=UPI003F1738E3